MSNQKLKERFEEFLSKFRDSKLAIVTHSRADADAIASAYAISKVFPKSVICTSEDMKEGAEMLAKKFGIEVNNLESFNKSDFEGLLVVDTSTYVLVPEAKGWKILCIIDHHRAEGRDMEAEYEIIDHESPSASEIIANILPDVDKDSAFALSVGIIADAARFKSARAGSFETLARLMKICEAEYAELLSYAEPEPKQETKIAMLKAMQRVEYIYTGGYIVATSEVGGNEGDAASLLAEAADVAFIAKWKDREQETRISARARSSVKVPLNEVLAEVGKSLGGAGGGHPKAAGAAVKVHTEEALQKCIEVFTSKAS